MKILFKRINYEKLNARQKENYNYQKISAILADYGYVTFRLSDDWLGADFIAFHINGITFIKVQLKGRLTFQREYLDKDIYICFPYENHWYIFPHDELLAKVLEKTTIRESISWSKKGAYSFPGLSKDLKSLLAPYVI